jgi:hypothetical protein
MNEMQTYAHTNQVASDVRFSSSQLEIFIHDINVNNMQLDCKLPQMQFVASEEMMMKKRTEIERERASEK